MEKITGYEGFMCLLVPEELRAQFFSGVDYKADWGLFSVVHPDIAKWCEEVVYRHIARLIDDLKEVENYRYLKKIGRHAEVAMMKSCKRAKDIKWDKGW